MQYYVEMAMKLAGSVLFLSSFSSLAEPIKPTLKFYQGKNTLRKILFVR